MKPPLRHRSGLGGPTHGLSWSIRLTIRRAKQFMERHRSILGWIPPAGGTVAFPWLLDGRDSRPLCQALAREGVLVAPGDCFGLAEHFRIGVGAEATGFQEALGVASRVFIVEKQDD